MSVHLIQLRCIYLQHVYDADKLKFQDNVEYCPIVQLKSNRLFASDKNNHAKHFVL